jgi:hypothetical protein
VTLHRLNRAEYNNTVRDLLGTATRPADSFPIDDRGGGFDNIADVLTLSPLHLSLYDQAARALVVEALGNATQRARVLTCDVAAGGEACVRTALTAFVRRAFRRPATADEVTRFMTVAATAVTAGDGYGKGLELALRAVLMSPNFTFRVEIDPQPRSLTPHPLSGYEVASRLAYFLWSSMPDDTLLDVAASGKLTDPTLQADQIKRMLADPKAKALVDNFAGQWLFTRAMDTATPDPGKFATFDAPLRAAMKAETEMLFQDVAFRGLPANQLLTADFTYVNDRLATHYGLPKVGTTQMTRVSLAGNAQRKGLLSQGTFLVNTSYPDKTSPVLRGKWVMDEILCQPIPPPPPDINTQLPDAVAEGVTQREILAIHRAEIRCAACHNLMDSIGLGLENYDAVGAYRTLDGKAPIDSTGILPTGEPFSGVGELSPLLAKNPAFASCMASKLYSYALGRVPESTSDHMDPASLEAIKTRFVNSTYSFAELVLATATAPTFLNRRGDPTPEAP